MLKLHSLPIKLSLPLFPWNMCLTPSHIQHILYLLAPTKYWSYMMFTPHAQNPGDHVWNDCTFPSDGNICRYLTFFYIISERTIQALYILIIMTLMVCYYSQDTAFHFICIYISHIPLVCQWQEKPKSPPNRITISAVYSYPLSVS